MGFVKLRLAVLGFSNHINGMENKTAVGNIKFTKDFTVHDFLETFSKSVVEGYVEDFGHNGWDHLISCEDTFEVLDLLEPYIPEDHTD